MKRREALKRGLSLLAASLTGAGISKAADPVIRKSRTIRLADGVQLSVLPEFPADYPLATHFSLAEISYTDLRGKAHSNKIGSLNEMDLSKYPAVRVDAREIEAVNARKHATGTSITSYAGLHRSDRGEG